MKRASRPASSECLGPNRGPRRSGHDEELRRPGLELGGAAEISELTAPERGVLALVAQGFSDAEIAERLVGQPAHRARHVANVRTKLRLPSRAAAVA